MRKEKQIHEHERKQLLDELSKMPDMVIATAYLEAINYTLYGVDVAEAWNTVIQQNAALEKAYVKGYADGIENTAREFKHELDQNSILDKISADIRHFMYDINPSSSESDYACDYILNIIDKYRAESEGER